MVGVPHHAISDARCKLQATRRVTAEKTDIELCQEPALRKVLKYLE